MKAFQRASKVCSVSRTTMDFRILGPLEVHGDLGAIDVPGTKRRAVLAVLLLQANEAVSPERIAVALWGEDAPAGAVKTVQVHVSRLRKALGDEDLLKTTPAGYRLKVEPGELDAERFEKLVERGRAALVAGRPEEAGAVLRKALALWRGPPLADLAFEPFAQVEIARLEEEQQTALEMRVEADLAAGRHAELVAELRRMVAKHPARERLAGHLMLALYRCGRQSEALEAYHEARQRLGDEAGVEPGEELHALQDAILHHDPALAMASAEALPHELDVTSAPPLLGREDELKWLRDRWDEARAGTGRVVVLAGGQGMGKTRLVAELAADAHAHGATVLYASGDGPPRAVHEVLGRAAGANRPLLLVVDDADEAGEAVLGAVRDASGGSTLVVATAKAPEALEALQAGGVLHLKRLSSSAVGQIATLYAPDSAAQDVPAEWLLGASDGVPRRVHDVAGLWARRETARRIGAVAGRTAAGRSRLRSMEEELAVGVVQLQGTREWPEDGGDGKQHLVCPFKGLVPFEAADAPYFFGRERLVAELVARLVGAPLLGVIGPSGSGKSSAVRAGLLPALASGVLPGSQDWPQRVIRPGEHPMRQLDRALDGIEGDRLVLAVDQLEEVFTACRDESERVAFFAELVGAAGDDPGGAVVLAVRADFYGRCAAYPALSRALASNHVLVGPMRNDELQRAIVCPAQRVGLTVEDDLVDAMVDDVEEAPGALPLVSTALLELWQHRDGRRLQLVSYERTGGVRGAVARLAEDAFGDLDESRQSLARRVLLQLVEVDDEGTVERHRRGLDELVTSQEVKDLVDVLADRRLVTVSEGTVELAHEAVLREWPRLRDWIDAARDDLKLHRNLSVAEKEWTRLDRDESALYRGAHLAEAREWAARGDPGPSTAEQKFLAASQERELRERRGHRRRLVLGAAALTAGVAAIAATAVIALHQRGDAVRQRDIAVSHQLALESGKALVDNPELAVRLALWADDTAPTEQAASALREATLAFHQLSVLQADSLDANAADYSPDGEHIVTGGTDGVALLWDVATGHRMARLDARHGAVLAARYEPGGDAIALGFEDGTVAITDDSLSAPREVLHVEGQRVEDVAFSGDGSWVAAALGDGTVRVLSTDHTARTLRLSGHDGPVLGVDLNTDGSRVVSAGDDGSVRLWNRADGATGRVLLNGGTPVTDVAFTPDGSRIVSVGDDGRIRLWNTRTGAQVRSVSGQGRLTAVAFSADGSRFAAGGRDGSTRVWSVAGGAPVAVLRGQRSRVYDVRFGPRSDRVVSAGDDGTVRTFDAGRTRAWTVPSYTFDLDFNRDGTLLAGGGQDGTVRVWDTNDGRTVASLPGPEGYVAPKFSPTTDTLVVPNWDASTVRMWPVRAGSAETVVHPPALQGVESAGFDKSGERIVYVADKGGIVVRDLRSGREVTLGGARKTGIIWGAEFSPDGKHVAALPEKGDVLVWRVDRPTRPEYSLKGHRGRPNELAYGPDERLVTAGADRTVRVWDPGGGSAVVMRGHDDEVTTAVFTADGSKVLSSSKDGKLRLWDARTGAALAVLQSDEGVVADVALSRDGKIATLSKNTVVQVFECKVCGSLADVRALARSQRPRQLTADEQRRFLAEAGEGR
jgi:WD40 repeat protein/DNA-binding SARP family transcriptional activator